MNLRLEKRHQATAIQQVVATMLALLCALGVSALLIASAGVAIEDAVTAFGRGAFGNRRAIAGACGAWERAIFDHWCNGWRIVRSSAIAASAQSG